VKALILSLLLLCSCREQRPAAPTAQESAHLNEMENELDSMDNEEGPADRSTGPSNSSD
jgi:hypothetical protein